METDTRRINYEAVRRYDGAAALLPARLRKAALILPEESRAAAEELRIRAGRPMTVLLPGPDGLSVEQDLGVSAEPEELETLCDLATEFSRYAAAETIRDGFLTVRGGYRIGLCGTAVVKNGMNTNLRNLSSAVIRICREYKGIAVGILPRLFREGEFQDTLILSPPGGGKTTLLRDCIRILSDGVDLSGGRDGIKSYRIALIDERGEIALTTGGIPRMDVGSHTDVLDACPKALGIPIVLRAMNPRIIAVDEIATREDLDAIRIASGRGVRLLASIHASGVRELKEKPLYRELLTERVFRLAVRIETRSGGRRYEVEPLWEPERLSLPEAGREEHPEERENVNRDRSVEKE